MHWKASSSPELVLTWNVQSIIKLDDAYPTKGLTLCWVETPLNPTGECRSIEFYAKKVHALGGILAVDSTFGPPPLQDPFAWGADIVMRAYHASSQPCSPTDLLLDHRQRNQVLWRSLGRLDRYPVGQDEGRVDEALAQSHIHGCDARRTRELAHPPFPPYSQPRKCLSSLFLSSSSSCHPSVASRSSVQDGNGPRTMARLPHPCGPRLRSRWPCRDGRTSVARHPARRRREVGWRGEADEWWIGVLWYHAQQGDVRQPDWTHPRALYRGCRLS